MKHLSSQTLKLLDLLGIDIPLIQAPMAGVSNPTLALAVASAGGLGSLGLGGGNPRVLAKLSEQLGGADKPRINFNFFVHAAAEAKPQVEADWLNRLSPLFEKLEAQPPSEITAPYGSFDDNPATLPALLELEPAVVSFHFGLPKPATISALKAAGCVVMSSATTPMEAEFLEQGGADIVIAQGWGAGGHRGQFLQPPTGETPLSTSALLPQICAAVSVPVIAAGGIATGEAAARALQLGAAGVQIGTAFVSCPESSAGPAYRNALKDQNAKTLMTSVFSGRPARGLQNELTRCLHENADQVPDYPIAYAAGKALATAAELTNDEQQIQNYSAMWAGESFQSNRVMPAAELVATISAELVAALEVNRSNLETGNA